MSVSFSPEFQSNVPHHIVCVCGEWSDGVQYDSFEDAHAILPSIKNGCSDVFCDYLYAEPIVLPAEVQMSNGNAVTILDVLGIQVGEDFSDRCCGAMSGEDLKGRILVAQALNPVDAGSDTMRIENVTFIGRSAGYTDAKLDALMAVAEEAISKNLKVTWG